MEFEFQQFQSGLPVWTYIIFIFLTTLLSWWSYKNMRSVRPLIRYGLITMRSLVFFILLIILLNPLFKAENTRLVRPNIMVLFDNTSSVSISKGEYDGIESYQNSIENLRFNDSARASFRFYSFGERTVPTKPDSLTFDDSETNIFEAIEAIKNNEHEVNSAILFSDGIFNSGRNPAFLSQELEIPVFTIGLGDTTRLKDLIVRNVTTNATGYLNTRHPVEATIVNQGLRDVTFQVHLISSGEIIESKTVNSISETSSHTIKFELDLEKEGLRPFEIKIPVLRDEFTDVNNTIPFSIEVLDDKQKILHLAFEIHPDVKAIRTLLEEDENTHLYTRTWLNGNKFIEGDFNISSDSLDLVVVHGYPSRLPPDISNVLNDLTDNIPTIVFDTPASRLGNMPNASTVLPIQQVQGIPDRDVHLAPALESTEHPVMELPEVTYERLPPIKAPIRGIEYSPGTTVLFNSSFRGTDTSEPLIAVKQLGNLRSAHINGHGWFRLAQSTNPQARSFFQSLMFNLVSWAATLPDSRKLKIQPDHKIFTGNDPISFNAFLTNESGEVESDAVIEVQITGNQIEPRFFNMNKQGSGQYKLEIGNLSEGIYQFEAVAKKGSREIDRQQGEFSVSGSNREFTNIERNDRLLKQISTASGGEFLDFQETDKLWSIINEQGLLDKNEISENELFYPYQHMFWFLIVVLLLGSEWLLRKYVALP